MTGTFEYEKGDKRAGAGLQRVLPLLRDLSLSTPTRSGTSPRCAAGARSPKPSPTAGTPRRPRASIAPTSISKAAKLLVDEGKAKKADFPWDSDGYRAADGGVHRRHRLRRPQAQRLPREARDRPQGRSARRRRKVVATELRDRSQAMRRTTVIGNDRRCRCNDVADPTTAVATRGASAGIAHRRAAGYLELVGLGWLVPLLRIAAGDSPRRSSRSCGTSSACRCWRSCCSSALWALLAPQVKTSLGALPGPAQVWTQARQSLRRPSRRARKGARLLRAAGQSATPNCWREDPKAEVEDPALHRQADLSSIRSSPAWRRCSPASCSRR